MAITFVLPETGDIYFRGDKIELEATITEGGVPKPLDDYEITFTAKVQITDADTDPTTIQHTSSEVGEGQIEVIADGLIHITILPEDTNGIAQETKYTCDIQIQNTSDHEEVKTVGKGDITVSVDVTRDYVTP